ncbi:fungal-specific transcription factor domain-containing protein [Colletotrichum navitas]|uniref:Fungal-specific transcription factor domain-containing protein n=1 Tax=Colletotrichum navitas TaxID=681940 RepID=A0AAD8PTY0_9PEZI|nr:fungal-specific transcription factor domain-containing protein [Colletotrichum navitas]KAK1580140.1 fungal-specific transcription factor domain-containing protein [Colletotrichum navitas]
MLSNPLHRFSPYHGVQSSALFSNAHVPNGHSHANGLDPLAPNSHYALQQLQHHVGAHGNNPHLARGTPQSKHRQHPYGPAARSSSASGPIRRRISRACDQCNQLRTKCDGQHPCAHCVEFGLGCEYIRERKKRGKASRKDLAAQAAAQAASGGPGQGQKSPSDDNGPPSEQGESASVKNGQSSGNESQQNHGGKVIDELSDDAMQHSQRTGSLDSLGDLAGGHPAHLSTHHGMDRDHHIESPTAMDLNGYGGVHGGYDRQSLGAHMMPGPSHAAYAPSQSAMSAYPEIPYAMQTQSPTAYANSAPFRIAASPISAYPLGGEATSPEWISMSPPPAQYPSSHIPGSGYGHAVKKLRYPVLQPLLPHLGNLIPLSLACDLIDLYFASSSSAQMHPMSPYVLGFVFRKRSFLHPTKPRHCQPALLASMLWVAAQTSDAPFLTSVPSARGKICQRLLELTVSLLKPLIHAPSGDTSPVTSPVIDGVALGGLGVALPGSISMDALSGESGPFGAAGSLDDVITYIHLATVVSASEYKGASLRWWNAAWSLARELKLGRELPPTPPLSMSQPNGHEADGGDVDGEGELGVSSHPGAITEEEREERRRIWWLAYIVDRHLALCYNRPLFLLDLECAGLLQPMDDTAWQNGEFRPATTHNVTTDPSLRDSSSTTTTGQQGRVRGPHFECTGHSIFGYFLPLMTILGEIVDLHHARNHPRFGVGFRSAREWDDQASEITRHLEAYEKSLRRFEQQHLTRPSMNLDDKGDVANPEGVEHSAIADIGTPSVHSVHTNASNRMTESDIQTKIVMAYGTHVMHVLHILLAGKWDPINLIDDNDLWISSQGFITATGHAVSAAEAINNILEFDPGLEFMPFFFGIYLLQGSFLLLLIADKLQLEASPSVVKACETIVRAHEACVVTLNTEYQRNFSKVMRSALAQVRGRVPEDLNEQHQRRRELLALYRWTGDGTGLAL